MHNSNTIIGLHGANLTNSVFKKNGNLVEIMSGKGALSSELYMHLAEQRKINYYRIQFKKNKKNETVVDYKKLNNLLNKIKN